MPEGEAPKLLADAMLGKLARWLRVVGYDTRYLQGDDAYIAHRARAEGRILLTRDREFARRRGLQVVLVASQSLLEQLAEVLTAVGPPSEEGSRCIECNGTLDRLTPEAAAPFVPPYVAATQEIFHRCAECGRIYWQGTHWDGIKHRIQQLLAELAEDSA
jgi:uncharacterized protein